MNVLIHCYMKDSSKYSHECEFINPVTMLDSITNKIPSFFSVT